MIDGLFNGHCIITIVIFKQGPTTLTLSHATPAHALYVSRSFSHYILQIFYNWEVLRWSDKNLLLFSLRALSLLKIRNTVKYKRNGFNGSKFLWYKFYCILCTRVYCKHKNNWRKVVYDKYFEIIGQLFRAAIIIWLIRSLSMLNDKLSVLNMECWCFNKLLNRVDIFPFNKGVAIFL